MANVIKQLLVGIGVDYDKKGEQDAISGIDRVSSKALQLGTVVAGAFGAKALTVGFANSRDALGKFSETLGVTAEDVSALGNALAREGGSLDAYMSQLEGIEQLRAGLLVGDAEFISIAGKAGIDTTDLIAATDATQAYMSLADQFQTMTQQQRLNAANALGLDDASIRLLSRGRDGVEAIVESQRKMRPVTQGMTQSAREFNTQMHDLGQNVGAVTDKISGKLLPEVNKITQGINAWFTANDELIDQNLDMVLDPLADNFAAVATAGTLLAGSGLLKTFAGLATYIPLAGGGLATMAASLATISTLGAAGATGYAVGSIIEPYLDEGVKEDIGRTTARVFATFGNEEAKTALDEERMTLESQGLEQPGVPVWDWSAKQASESTGIDLPEWLFKPINTLGDEKPVELLPSWSTESVPKSTLPRVTPDEDVPDSDYVPSVKRVTPTLGQLEQPDDASINVTPTLGALEQPDDASINVTPVMGELSPYAPIPVDVMPQVADLAPVSMSMDVTPRVADFEPVPVDVLPQRVDVSPQRVERQVPQVQQAPQRVDNRPIRVEAMLNLDGNVIDRRIIDVTERQNGLALADLTSSIRG